MEMLTELEQFRQKIGKKFKKEAWKSLK